MSANQPTTTVSTLQISNKLQVFGNNVLRKTLRLWETMCSGKHLDFETSCKPVIYNFPTILDSQINIVIIGWTCNSGEPRNSYRILLWGNPLEVGQEMRG
jgi:hypothetical protein